MAYPNYAAATTGFPLPTSGVSVPAVVVLSGTGVAQVVNRNADGQGASGQFGSVIAEQMRGPQYVAPLAKSSTLQLTTTLKDAQGNSVSKVNTETYTSLNSKALSTASFIPPLPGQAWLPNTTAPSVPPGQTGPGGGNGLNWNSNVCTVSASGLITANNLGYAIIEVRYPLTASLVNNFLYAYLLVTVTTAGTDVE